MNGINDLIDLLARAEDPEILTRALTTLADAQRRLDEAQKYYDEAKAALVDILGPPPPEPAAEMSLAEMRAWLREHGQPVPVGRGASERAAQMMADYETAAADVYEERLARGEYEPLDWSNAGKAPESPVDGSEDHGDTSPAPEAPEPSVALQPAADEQPGTRCPDCGELVEDCGDDCVGFLMGTILAIDPGFRRTGWVVVEAAGAKATPVECGLVETQKSQAKVLVSADDWECCRSIARELLAIAGAHNPACLIVETPSGSKSSRAAKCMALAYAICATVSEARALPAVLVAAPAAKKAATGLKAASKGDVAAAVAHLLPPDWDDPWPRSKREHITDAAALVLGAWESEVVRMVRAL